MKKFMALLVSLAFVFSIGENLSGQSTTFQSSSPTNFFPNSLAIMGVSNYEEDGSKTISLINSVEIRTGSTFQLVVRNLANNNYNETIFSIRFSGTIAIPRGTILCLRTNGTVSPTVDLNGATSTDFTIEESSPNGHQMIDENNTSIVFVSNTNYRNNRSISPLDIIDIVGLGTSTTQYATFQPTNTFPPNIIQNTGRFSAYVNCDGDIYLCDLSSFTREINNWKIRTPDMGLSDEICDKLCSLVCDPPRIDTREKKQPELSKLTLYPNPTTSNVSIDIPQNSTGLLTIYNSSSLKIEGLNITSHEKHTIEINTNSYPSGVYFVILQADGKTYFEKLIISK